MLDLKFLAKIVQGRRVCGVRIEINKNIGHIEKQMSVFAVVAMKVTDWGIVLRWKKSPVRWSQRVKWSTNYP